MTNAHVVDRRAARPGRPAAAQRGRHACRRCLRKMNIVPARIAASAAKSIWPFSRSMGIKLPALPLATYSQVRQGETVFAFGSPGGLRNTLTHGLISAVARQIDPDSPLIYIQTDAPINPGNSGGPLVNTRGEVVGVNTFIVSQSGGNEGLGFAIPSATARTAFRQLKQYGQLRRQEIGIGIQTITPDMAAASASRGTSASSSRTCDPNGPADAAGVKVGDVLVSVDGQPAENLPTVNYFFRLRDSTERVKLVVMRGGGRSCTSPSPRRAAQRLRFGRRDRPTGRRPGRRSSASSASRSISASPPARRGCAIPTASSSRPHAAARGEMPLLPRDVIRSINNKQITRCSRTPRCRPRNSRRAHPSRSRSSVRDG